MIEHPPGDQLFPLRDRPDAVALGPDGVEHPRARRGAARVFTRYADLTHLALSDIQVLIATSRALYVLPRDLFAASDAPQRLLSALAARIASAPDGARRIARMAELDALVRRRVRPRATWAMAVLCVVAFVVERGLAPDLFIAGFFVPALVRDGDWWRLITANLLHGPWLHLSMNVLGLVVLGPLVERALGGARTVCIMAASGVGAMLASGLLLEESVVGASGVALGLAGALVWLELRRATELPAPWRFPVMVRPLILFALVIDIFVLGFLLPVIAGEAHLGGFVAGGVAAALLTRPGSIGRPVGLPTRVSAATAAGVTALAVGTATYELAADPDYALHQAVRLVQIADDTGLPPAVLNNFAWVIAIDEESTPSELQAALLLAERAVEDTNREEAYILDTLAEVHFQLGQPDLAIEAIDRAIDREPGEDYYVEQRRRFTGERDPDDRPPDPALGPREREAPLPPEQEGLRV